MKLNDYDYKITIHTLVKGKLHINSTVLLENFQVDGLIKSIENLKDKDGLFGNIIIKKFSTPISLLSFDMKTQLFKISDSLIIYDEEFVKQATHRMEQFYQKKFKTWQDFKLEDLKRIIIKNMEVLQIPDHKQFK